MSGTEELRRRFAGRLTTWCDLRDLSQRDIARAIGVSPAQVNAFMHGRAYPTIEQHHRLADFLGMTWAGYRAELGIPELGEFSDAQRRLAPADWLAYWLERRLSGPVSAHTTSADFTHTDPREGDDGVNDGTGRGHSGGVWSTPAVDFRRRVTA